ncbi:MAG: hypothetical protein NZ937_06820 [Armatimonadetes bacterium]|nr:hypothetical protein [Armatimonadota bacterium]
MKQSKALYSNWYNLKVWLLPHRKIGKPVGLPSELDRSYYPAEKSPNWLGGQGYYPAEKSPNWLGGQGYYPAEKSPNWLGGQGYYPAEKSNRHITNTL